MNQSQLRTLVRRVVGRAMREPATGERAGRARGVHVELSACDDALRPQAAAATAGSCASSQAQGRVQQLVAEDLAAIADGQVFEVPAGARLTALARDEAWRRGIQLRESSAPARAGGGLRVAIGADHGGYPIKEQIKGWLSELGHVAIDLGTHDTNAVDYPDFAGAVAEAVADGRADFGVCVDGAGIGSAMAANKVPGARAAMCYDEKTARNAREHNFANVLSLGGPMLGEQACEAILRAFLTTPEGAPRHARRVAKIMELEARGTGRTRPLRKVLPSPGET
jgi:ribose 5-phosphate isomerase B